MDMSGMTMASSTMAMSMSMTSTGSMATSTSTMDMGDDSSSMTMTSADMMMVFFQSVSTPLFSMDWTPSGTGPYAGTCIFLIVLATLHCILQAVRNVLARSVWLPLGTAGDDSKGLEGDATIADRSVTGALSRSLHSHPFRISIETSRALFEVFSSGIGYLLMLAVMTMNVGYFLSVLGGIFLGTFLVGRFGSGNSHH
ncbi:hypothetical protein GQ53DRAFT_508738 [Thozetella sp. PMI_491]|nr:hypothetical protein GQ53DRAFT_508738 [Thozetella sp. PMI_491]